MIRVSLRLIALSVVVLLSAGHSALCELQVLDAFYRPDRMLPEWNYFWAGFDYRPGDMAPSYAASGALVVYVRNNGASSVTLSDVTLQGISLTAAFGCKTDKTYRDGLAYACSIHYPSATPITSTQRQTLISAGEPVWWRIDPKTLAPGATAEIFIRMRTRVLATLSLTVVSTTEPELPASITVSNIDIPRIAGYGLSPDSKKLYLYMRHPHRGKAPSQVLVDGVDKTSACTVSSDPAYDLVPVICSLGSALTRGSFHCFQVLYDDGSKASFGARVYYDEFQYGRWGQVDTPTTADAVAAVDDMGVHSITLQVQGAGDLNHYLESTAGQAHMAQLGIWRLHQSQSTPRHWGLFLCDEPDCGEVNVPTTVCPSYAQVGSLAQSMVNRAEPWRTNHSDNPNNVNVDGTNKPVSWYHYGQIPDVYSSDPYYSVRIADAYWTWPHQIPIYSKAIYIYAVASTCQAACEPRPMNLILQMCRKQDGTRVFRWNTPEEKRIECYYAIAAGARQISYWWFTAKAATDFGHAGCATDEPGAKALWREIGLLGAEFGTASPVIVNSSPLQIPIAASPKLWTRALLSRSDTMVLLCVNDDYADTDGGTLIRPIRNASVRLDLPNWLSPTQVFEVDYRGLHDVPYWLTGRRLSLELGAVDVTRMIIITSDPALRDTLQARYTTTYAPRVNKLIALP
jgi:hypothetical protein